VSEARSPRAAREDNARASHEGDPLKRLPDDVNHPVSPVFVSSPRSPEPRLLSPRRKAVETPGTSEVRVNVFVRVAFVGRSHRALSSLGALARRNLAAPSDTAREGRDGEPVRV